jgi:hypothetical protein
MTARTKLTLSGLILVAIVALLYPIETTVCPAWTIQIVDSEGNPLENAFVRQHWQNFSIELSGHEQDAETDENGFVSFPERTITAPLWMRVLGIIRSTVSGGLIHSSYGPRVSLAAYGDIVGGKRLEGTVFYDGSGPLPKRLETRVADLGFE